MLLQTMQFTTEPFPQVKVGLFTLPVHTDVHPYRYSTTNDQICARLHPCTHSASVRRRSLANTPMEALQELSDRLGVNLSGEALEAISDLLRAGVPVDTVVAIVDALQQQARRS